MRASLKRWIGRVPDVSAVFARFPVAVALMAIFTLLIIVENRIFDNEPLGRMAVGLIIGAYLAFCFTIASEAKGQSKRLPLQILVAVAIAVLAWFSKALHLNLAMAVGAVLLILGNMVIWRQNRDDLHVWDFTHKIWTGAVFATVGSIIFTLGVLAIQTALKSLFGVDMNELTERLILPIGLGFLAPLYWLSTAPRTDESYQELYDSPGFVSKAVAFFGTWLLSPLTLIYALILLAYGVKIILAGSLPKGEIAQLTTPFLLIGGLTWLILDPPFIRDKSLAKLFRKLWFPLSIPAAILLAIAVGVRLSEYSFTPDRVFLVLVVIWALAVGLWFTFGPKVKRDIRLVPGIAAGLLAIGALAADNVSLLSQQSRAIEGLKSAGIMTEAGVIKPQNMITVTDEAAALRAKGGLSYLARNEEKKALDRIFADAENIPETQRYGNDKLFKRLALDNIYTPGKRRDPTRHNYAGPKDLSVVGYDHIIQGKRVYLNETTKTDRDLARDISASFRGYKIEITAGDDEAYTLDMMDYIESLKSSGEASLPKNGVIVLNESGGKKLSFVIQTLNATYDKNDALMNTNVTYALLTRGY